MKNIAFLLILISGIVFLDACKEAETGPVLDMSTAVKPSITEPADGVSLVLTEDNANEELTFSWTAAQYNLTDLAATSYLLQMVNADSTDAVRELVSTTETSYKTTYGELNAAMLKMGFTPELAGNVTFKVNASLRSFDDGAIIAGTVLDANPVNASVTPYETAAPPEYAKLWVPGDYQGWNPGEAPTVLSFDDDGIYTGYIYFPDAEGATFEFKLTSEPGWDGTNYGAGESDGTLSDDSGAGNLTVPGPGGYRINIDINSLTWNYELQTWGIIGEFNGWSEQVNLEWDPENLYLTLTTDIAAADDNRFKFRANDNWDMSLGDIDPPDGETLISGGSDIPITDGNRTINLILSGPEPKYEIIEN